MVFLKWLISFAFGDAAKAVSDWHARTLASGDTRVQIDADLTKKAADIAIREDELRTERARIDGGGSWLQRNIRPLFALAYLTYYVKAVVADKVVGPWLGYNWSTDPITGDLATVSTTIVSFYLGGKTLELVAARFARR